MKRDWNKINFWMAWFILFLSASAITSTLLIKLGKQQAYDLEYGCAVRGLNVYKDGVECISDDGQLYDVPIQYTSSGWLILSVPLFILLLFGCVYSFHIIYNEYQRGD